MEQILTALRWGRVKSYEKGGIHEENLSLLASAHPQAAELRLELFPGAVLVCLPACAESYMS